MEINFPLMEMFQLMEAVSTNEKDFLVTFFFFFNFDCMYSWNYNTWLQADFHQSLHQRKISERKKEKQSKTKTHIHRKQQEKASLP